MRYKYTDDDISFLKINYPIGNWDSISKRFPFLSNGAIQNKCNKLGISSKFVGRKGKSFSHTSWSNEEIEILKQNYATKTTDELIKLLPLRNKNMIMNKASDLKLRKLDNKWTCEQIDYISRNWEVMPDMLIAKNIGRTFRATKAKREELGFYRRDIDKKASYPTLSKYIRGHIQKWKNESMKHCDYECVFTGSKDFEIHHLYGVSNILDDVLSKYPIYKDKSFSEYTEDDLSFLLSEFVKEQDKYPLGECVAKGIHILFHSAYGQYYNTPEQWYRFKEDYKKGEYNI